MSDRILVVGFEAQGDRIERAEFDSATPLDDYTWVAIDPATVAERLQGLGAPDAEAGNEAADTLVRLLQRRRREASEVLRGGGAIVCIFRPLGMPVSVQTPGPQGAASVVIHSYSWLPDEPALAQLVVAAPRDAEVRAADASHPGWAMLQAQGARVRPVAVAANRDVPPNWHVVATDADGRPAAFEVRVGQGRVIFVPPMAVEEPAKRGLLLEGLLVPPVEAVGGVSRGWLAEITLPGQEEVTSRLGELAEQIERLEKEFIEVRKQHAPYGELNRLLGARNARELAGPATNAFRLMGFEVEEAGAGGFLAARSDEGAAAVALAASRDAIDSDAYWALVRRLDESEAGPVKGIIVGNAHCLEPPAERGAPFSDLLRRGAVHRSVCLLSSVELHRAVAAILARRDDAELRRSFRRTLLAAAGPCALCEAAGTSEEPQ